MRLTAEDLKKNMNQTTQEIKATEPVATDKDKTVTENLERATEVEPTEIEAGDGTIGDVTLVNHPEPTENEKGAAFDGKKKASPKGFKATIHTRSNKSLTGSAPFDVLGLGNTRHLSPKRSNLSPYLGTMDEKDLKVA